MRTVKIGEATTPAACMVRIRACPAAMFSYSMALEDCSVMHWSFNKRKGNHVGLVAVGAARQGIDTLVRG